jgi:diguanylate cyclase (GGDEF)-like protein
MVIDAVALARFALAVVAISMATLAAVLWTRRRATPAATAFALLAAAMATYSFGYSGEVAQSTVADAKLWLDVEYLALPWIPGLWLLAACRQNARRVSRWILFAIPVVTFVGHYSNFRNLFYTAPMTISQRGPFWVLAVSRGPLSELDNAYLLVAFLVGGSMYLASLRHKSAPFRKQAIIMVLASLLPFIAYFAYFSGVSPWGLDLSPFTLGVSCLLFYYGLFHVGFFDLAPLARNLVFNSIRDSVLILDSNGKMLDFNQAALDLIPELILSKPGTEISDVLSDYPDFLEAIQRGEESFEISFGLGEHRKSFLVRDTPLQSQKNLVGHAVILADITAQAALREELRLLSETDPLTGVANRRRFHKVLGAEFAEFKTRHAPFCLFMIDLDFFKVVNDQYGHLIGDDVLRLVAQRMLAGLRKSDLLARYGGEEFSALLPKTCRAHGAMVAERMRQSIAEAPFDGDGFSISLSVSIGVAYYSDKSEPDLQTLQKAADRALYRAKELGRNRIEVV